MAGNGSIGPPKSSTECSWPRSRASARGRPRLRPQRVQRGDRRSQILWIEVRIAMGHRQTLVAKQDPDRVPVHVRHGEPLCERVPQVKESFQFPPGEPQGTTRGRDSS